MLSKQMAYMKWLGIKGHDQPPTLYRLVGVEAFESDPDIISYAVDSRMTLLRQFQLGDNAAVVEEILNELSNARVTLLNAGMKSAYDVRLRQQIPVQNMTAGSANAVVQAATPLRRAKSMANPTRTTQDSPTPVLNVATLNAGIPPTIPESLKRNKRADLLVWAAVATATVLLLGTIAVFNSLSKAGDSSEDASVVASRADAPKSPAHPIASIVKSSPSKRTDSPPNGAPNHEDPRAVEPTIVAPVVAAPNESSPPSSERPSPLASAETPKERTELAPVPDVGAQGASKKVAPPAADQIKQAEAIVNDLYRKELARPSKEFSAQLLKLAQETKGDFPGQYVLFRKAIEIGALTGDTQTVHSAIAGLDATFDLNTLPIWIDALGALSTRADVSDTIAPIFARACQADDYDSAVALANLGLVSARGTNNLSAIKTATAKAKEVVAMREAFKATIAARKKLADSPADPEANRIVGSFLCFFKNDWVIGIPMLALSDDKSLQSLAALETKDGKTPLEIVSLGDGWAKSGRKDRAVYWYKQALPNVTGLVKVRVEKELAAAESTDEPVSDIGKSLVTTDALKKKFRGRVTYNPRTEEVQITYNWSAPKNQVLDFELGTSKPAVEQGALVLRGGESIRHVADFAQVTVAASVFVTVMKGNLVTTSGGAVAKVGGGNPDTMYLDDGQSPGVYFLVPEADRTGLKPVRLTVTATRLGFDFGKYALGKPTSDFHAGQVSLHGGEVGFKFGTLVITGKLDAAWAAKFVSGKH